MRERCRISELFFAQNKQNERRTALYRTRQGVIVGQSRDGTSWSVLWDGYKGPDSWHKDYIEIEPGSEGGKL